MLAVSNRDQPKAAAAAAAKDSRETGARAGAASMSSAEDAGTYAANPFTQYYAQLLHQGNMLQDAVRTSTYQQAMLQNAADFVDKVVLDVGTGTGILSFFATQAGAKKVYAVEASDSAEAAQVLVTENGLQDRIQIVRGKVEEVEIPEKVDVIVSEPIGFLLVHERMLESYVIARERFLKPDGKMFPTTGTILLAPCTDEAIYNEQLSKIAFWQNNDFYGVNLSPLVNRAFEEYFAQPVVGYFHPSILLSSERARHTIDFQTASVADLKQFSIPFRIKIERTAIMHGFGGWFDASFVGSEAFLVLSTAPECPGTHWYQCRLLLREPLAVNKGQYIVGEFRFRVNDKFSYFIDFDVTIEGTDITTSNHVNLQDQMYHYLTSNAPAYQA